MEFRVGFKNESVMSTIRGSRHTYADQRISMEAVTMTCGNKTKVEGPQDKKNNRGRGKGRGGKRGCKCREKSSKTVRNIFALQKQLRSDTIFLIAHSTFGKPTDPWTTQIWQTLTHPQWSWRTACCWAASSTTLQW